MWFLVPNQLYTFGATFSRGNLSLLLNKNTPKSRGRLAIDTMPFNIYHLFLLTSLALSSAAFKVSFYENLNCTGALEGTWIGGEGQGCSNDFV